MRQYAERNHKDLEPFYLIHVSAMTKEKLHTKCAIAAELALRDRKISAFEKLLETANSNACSQAALSGKRINELESKLNEIKNELIESLKLYDDPEVNYNASDVIDDIRILIRQELK